MIRRLPTFYLFFFNDTATTEIYTLSLHDALPIWISRSREMAPWDVDAGYSRPICRRILETAGVPREAFGVRKQTASVLFFERGDFLSPPSLADFRSWLGRHGPRARWAAPGLWPRPARAAERLLDEAARLSPHRLRLLQSLGTRIDRKSVV